MSSIFLIVGLFFAVLATCVAIYLISARTYQSSTSVADAYDQWTEDGILEFYWGDHIHLGHYGSPPRRKDFRAAKTDFVH
ncbi:MAG: SAM-dependent methyltransferase, partial [Cyanobacteria bacterium J06659_2]